MLYGPSNFRTHTDLADGDLGPGLSVRRDGDRLAGLVLAGLARWLRRRQVDGRIGATERFGGNVANVGFGVGLAWPTLWLAGATGVAPHATATAAIKPRHKKIERCNFPLFGCPGAGDATRSGHSRSSVSCPQHHRPKRAAIRACRQHATYRTSGVEDVGVTIQWSNRHAVTTVDARSDRPQGERVLRPFLRSAAAAASALVLVAMLAGTAMAYEDVHIPPAACDSVRAGIAHFHDSPAPAQMQLTPAWGNTSRFVYDECN